MHCAAQPALAEGADLVIQSTHKMLPAMTQASMLHLRGSCVSPDRVSKALHTLQVCPVRAYREYSQTQVQILLYFEWKYIALSYEVTCSRDRLFFAP